MADLMAANGFSNFTTQDAAGNKGTPGSATSSNATMIVATSSSVASAAGATLAGTADQCSAQVAAGECSGA